MNQQRVERIVKVGRILIVPIAAYHWAIKVGDIWYEIKGASKKDSGALNEVIRSKGYKAQSNAGSLGGEVVGKTIKTDREIDDWIEIWLAKNPRYMVLTDNCQAFVFDMMAWVTGENYIMKHRVDAASTLQGIYHESLIVEDDGNAIARYCFFNGNTASGPFNLHTQALEGQAQAVAGPGFGVFVDAALVDARLSAGNVIGARGGLRVDTGVGIRNGNLEAHLAGFGGKIGADGIEINTPIFGVNACSVM